jgi:hypothetical protein
VSEVRFKVLGSSKSKQWTDKHVVILVTDAAIVAVPAAGVSRRVKRHAVWRASEFAQSFCSRPTKSTPVRLDRRTIVDVVIELTKPIATNRGPPFLKTKVGKRNFEVSIEFTGVNHRAVGPDVGETKTVQVKFRVGYPLKLRIVVLSECFTTRVENGGELGLILLELHPKVEGAAPNVIPNRVLSGFAVDHAVRGTFAKFKDFFKEGAMEDLDALVVSVAPNFAT